VIVKLLLCVGGAVVIGGVYLLFVRAVGTFMMVGRGEDRVESKRTDKRGGN
jgi:hypothetical protein